MFYFVEFLRAQRTMRIVAILLGCLILLAIVLRIVMLRGTTPEAYINGLQHSPTAHVTQTKLADGTMRTVVDDPARKMHAVIDRRGANTFRVDVTEPASSAAHRHQQNDTMGSLDVNESTRAGMSHTTIVWNGTFNINLTILILATMPMGLIVATMLGGVLSKENDGHLELAWTKPVSRESYALAAIGVDLVTIVVSQLLTLAVVMLCILLFGVPSYSPGRDAGAYIALALIGPLSWYACLTAFSASVKRGPGIVIGLGWLAALLIPGIAAAFAQINHPLAHAIYNVFQALAYLDPIAYFSHVSDSGVTKNGAIATLGEAVIAVIALLIAYIAAAVLQWRRVEA